MKNKIILHNKYVITFCGNTYLKTFTSDGEIVTTRSRRSARTYINLTEAKAVRMWINWNLNTHCRVDMKVRPGNEKGK